MVRHQQEFFLIRPCIVFANDRCQFGNAPGGQVALQNEVQHGHEMALAAAKAAVQIARLACSTVHALLMKLSALSKHAFSSGVTT